MSSAAWERYQRAQRRQALLCAIDWVVIVGVVSLATALASHAKQEIAKPDIAQFVPRKALDARSDMPPCMVPRQAPQRIYWVLKAKDGTTLIVGAEDVRKRC
ncbi:hypothetical protein A6U86_05525 [Rhizobium sp. AC27/96]|nr:hypothetical protein A6U86_05525 [Rhizobium sp. AC27/96]